MPRAPDFFKQLDRDELNKLEAFAREPGRTVDDVHDWMLTRGYTASRSAVGNWKRKFDETDALSAATDLADAIHTANAESGTVDLAGAINLQIAQRLQSLLVRASEDGNDLDVDAILKAARTVNNLGQAQQRVVELKRVGTEQLNALKGEAKKRTITVDDIDRVSKAVFG